MTLAEILSRLLDAQRKHLHELARLEDREKREYGEIRFTEGIIIGLTEGIDIVRAAMTEESGQAPDA